MRELFVQNVYFMLMWVLVAACLGGGTICLRRGKGDLGVALLSGGFLSLVSLFAQAGFQVQSDRDNAALRAAAYRDSLSMTQELQGLNPGGRSLRGFVLADKNLTDALLQGAHLEHAVLTGSDLSSAHLDNAHLQDATLYRVRLQGAVLKGTDLRRADLRAAKFIDASVYSAKLLHAKVNKDTCWPTVMASLSKSALRPIGVDSEGRVMRKTVGHICDSGDDVKRDGSPAAPPDVRVRICIDGSTAHVDPREREEDKQPDACERH
jgi:Pentapeptide repeats (8 copies)